MSSIATDQSLRQQLISAGFERAEVFTWDKSAKRLWQTIEKVMNA